MKIHKGVLLEVKQKDIDNGVFVVPNNVKKIGSKCFSNVVVEKVIVQNGVKEIGSRAFEGCHSLFEVKLSYGIEKIGHSAFLECINLEHINLPASLKIIGAGAFYECSSLKSVIIPKKLIKLGRGAFAYCDDLKDVFINANLKELEDETFKDCLSLKNISLPMSIKEIGANCFSNCSDLEYIKWPTSLQTIKNSAFYMTGIRRLELPEDVRQIENRAFLECDNLVYVKIPPLITHINDGVFNNCCNLANVEFNQNIKHIGIGAFSNCSKLEDIQLPTSLKMIDSNAFFGCEKLKNIKFPDNLEEIGDYSFCDCDSLENITLNDGLKIIGESAFENSNLKYVDFPASLEEIHDQAFKFTFIHKVELGKNMQLLGRKVFSMEVELTLYDNNEIRFENLKSVSNLTVINPITEEKIVIDMLNISGVASSHGVMVFTTNFVSFFDNENKWVVVEIDEFERAGLTDKDNFKKYYEWMKKGKFLPNFIIMQNFPIQEINNFYINNNDKRWKELLRKSQISDTAEMEGFFKLAYSLGVFSKSAKTSKKACEFISQYVFDSVHQNEYHIRFGEMNVSSIGYDPEFAKLVFKYLPIEQTNFLYYINKQHEAKDCFSMVYNNFQEIKKLYYNKKVNTNSKREMLTPQLCMSYDFARLNAYKGVKPGNELLASYMAMYGYGQAVFNEVQRYFDIGKSIPKEELMLHIEQDSKKSALSYKLLEKDDEIGAILGNITNCCQTATGLAKKCVLHGLSQKNSGFISFNNDDHIVGQSWVWYDEQQKRICLDNIEITKNVLESKLKALRWKSEMINCVKRLADAFVIKMEEKGFDVETITVGEGFNDVGKLMDIHFKKITNQPPLTGYNGYSDAKNQYVIYDRNKMKKTKDKK